MRTVALRFKASGSVLSKQQSTLRKSYQTDLDIAITKCVLLMCSTYCQHAQARTVSYILLQCKWL